MRGNNVPAHLVPHQMNVQLRRYPESPLLRAPSLIGITLGLTAQAAQDERSNRSGSTSFLSGRAQSKQLDGPVIGGSIRREWSNGTTRRLANLND